jgi:hypothetical protein
MSKIEQNYIKHNIKPLYKAQDKIKDALNDLNDYTVVDYSYGPTRVYKCEALDDIQKRINKKVDVLSVMVRKRKNLTDIGSMI